MAISTWESKSIPDGWKKKQRFGRQKVEGADYLTAVTNLVNAASGLDPSVNWILEFRVKQVDNSNLHKASGVPYQLEPI